MEFMLITLVTLAICVFLTFKIINHFGLRLGMGSLFLCALCALSINFVLPSVTLYASNYHFIFFVGLTLLSALLITLYNERFSPNQPDDEVIDAVQEVRSNYLSCLQPALVTVGTPFLTTTKIFVPVIHSRPARIEPIPEKAAAPIPIPALFIIQAEIPFPKPFHFIRTSHLPAVIIPSIRALVEQDMLKKARERKMFSQFSLWSLDALLEYAYDQKTAADLENALLAFRCALDRFKNDDYAPFITIEIGNIYKNTGLYDEAIVIYNKAFYLRAVMVNDELKKEFRNMIYYLHILKIMLRAHHYQTIPFDQIPKAIMQETETEFQVWLSQKYAS